MIRQLRAGETPPEGEPRRFKNASGYVRLRWRIGPDQMVECYEHRLVAGAEPGDHVHHLNGVKDDNRPENLQRLTAAEHMSHHHAVYTAEDFGPLYKAGWSTPEIAKHFGCHSSTVYRLLQRSGFEMRGMSQAVTAWHAKR